MQEPAPSMHLPSLADEIFALGHSGQRETWPPARSTPYVRGVLGVMALGVVAATVFGGFVAHEAWQDFRTVANSIIDK